MNTLLAVDGSSLFMRALMVLPEDKRTVDDLEYMVVAMLRKAVRFTEATHVVVALDTTEGCWRLDTHPGYKGSRQYSDIRPKQLTPMLIPRLEQRRIATAYNGRMEADDLLFTLACNLREGSRMLAYTRDSDMLFITHLPNVQLLWPGKEGALEVIDEAAAHERLGYPPAWQPAVRGLTADSKDDLRGLLSVPEGWRCPLTKPRAIELLKLHNGNLLDLLEDAVHGSCTGMKDKEMEYLCMYADQIGALWWLCTLYGKAELNVHARYTAVGGMDLSLPDNRQ